jgi:hypothetical protein
VERIRLECTVKAFTSPFSTATVAEE